MSSGNKMSASRVVAYDYNPKEERKTAVFVHYPFTAPPTPGGSALKGWIWEHHGLNGWTVKLPVKDLKRLEQVPGVTFVKVAQ